MYRTLITSALVVTCITTTTVVRAQTFSVQDLTSLTTEILERSRQNELAQQGVSLKPIARSGSMEEVSFETLYERVTKLQQALYGKVVYGPDGRVPISSVSDADVLRNAAAVVALMRPTVMNQNADGTWSIGNELYGDKYGLCEDEPFRDQPSPAFCSGFLVDSDLIATAGHCVKTAADLNITRFVFDFRMLDNATARLDVSGQDVFEGIELVGREEDSSGSDWALIRLDRPVENRVPVSLRKIGRIADDQSVYVIGHPAGLPMIYAPGANVRENVSLEYFVANLDTYGGNSGSLVANASTHEIEGILVRGEQDFVVTESGCRKSLVCPDESCRGEDVTRISEIIESIP